MHTLSHDELGVVFSYLIPAECILVLNLVCKQWYELTSIKYATNSGLWKQWYQNAIEYYASQTQKPYRKKWLLKKKNKTRRDYRALLQGIIINSRNVLKTKIDTKIQRIFNAYFLQIDHCPVGDYLDELLLLFRANKALVKNQGTKAQLLFNQIIRVLCTKNTNIDHEFTKLCELVPLMNLPTKDTKFYVENWKSSPYGVYENATSTFLPTQLLILYGHFNEAKILHEKYEYPLTLLVKKEKITSTTVLLFRNRLRPFSYHRERHYVPTTVSPEAHVEMLHWLIEKEGVPTQLVDLSTVHNCWSRKTPIACLVEQFYSDACVPLVKVLIECGIEIDSGLLVLCEYFENFVQNKTPELILLATEHVFVRKEIAYAKLMALAKIFKQHNARNFEKLEDRFNKIERQIRIR